MSTNVPKLSEIYATIKSSLRFDNPKTEYQEVSNAVRANYGATLPNGQIWKLVNHHKKQTLVAQDDL